MGSARETWISTDEAEDVAGSVRHTLRCFATVNEDEQAWKWAILALHSALQGACVCHLLTTAHPVGAVTRKNAKEWLVYFEARRSEASISPPRTILMSMPELLKAVRKPNSAGDRSNLVGVSLSDEQLVLLTRIHEDIRNQLVHFGPLGWSIDISGVPDLAKLISRLIKEITDFGWAFRHKGRRWREALVKDLTALGSVT